MRLREIAAFFALKLTTKAVAGLLPGYGFSVIFMQFHNAFRPSLITLKQRFYCCFTANPTATPQTPFVQFFPTPSEYTESG